MALRLNDVNGDASTAAYGFKATSRSLKPVHLAQVMFGHTLETVRSPEHLFAFCEKPGRTPSSELDQELKDLFESAQGLTDERLDNLRSSMRQVLANDNALFASQRGSAPTCTSDWFIINTAAGVTAGRFLYTLLDRAEGGVEEKLEAQLRDHHDAISLLFRPLAKDAEESSATVKRWEEPELGDAFGDGCIATEFVEGYTTLSQHLKTNNGSAGLNYPRDLRRVVKYGCFAFYLYLINRYQEIREGGGDIGRLPIVLNYTGSTNNPVADASLDCVRTAHSEVQRASRLGVEHELDRQGYRAYSEEEIYDLIEDRELLELNRQTEEKETEDYETFKDIYQADPAGETFEKLANAVSDAIHHSSSRFDTYTPQATAQTFGWRSGILKPRGNRANKRRYRPDPEILESIILSILDPGGSMSLGQLCEELRTRYGIIVGGTEGDRDHLSRWDIHLGASATERDPLNNRNYEGFKQAVVDLGYAQEYADGVTIVSDPKQS
jgi:hypothetical protein